MSAVAITDIEMNAPTFELDILPDPVAMCQLPAHAQTPDWIVLSMAFMTVTRTATELSIVADERVIPAAIIAQRGFRVFRVHGPLPLEMVGVMAALAGSLANAQVPIVPIGTVETDYILIHQQHVERATSALRAAGHTVHE